MIGSVSSRIDSLRGQPIIDSTARPYTLHAATHVNKHGGTFVNLTCNHDISQLYTSCLALGISDVVLIGMPLPFGPRGSKQHIYLSLGI